MNISVESSSHSKSEQLALQFLSRVWAPPHDLSAIDESMTEDFVITSGGNDVTGQEAFKAWVKEFQSLLLEAHTENLEIFANPADDRVVSRWICAGKNNGILGCPLTGVRSPSLVLPYWRSKMADWRAAGRSEAPGNCIRSFQTKRRNRQPTSDGLTRRTGRCFSRIGADL